MVGKDGPGFNVHIRPDDGVAHEIEVGHCAAFQQNACLDLTTDASGFPFIGAGIIPGN